jgi:hypothetical protein
MYWNHQEFGGHYFRPLSSWSIVNALLGLRIRDGVYRFAPALPQGNQRLFFSFEGGYGHYERNLNPSGIETVCIAIGRGTLRCSRLVFALRTRTPSLPCLWHMRGKGKPQAKGELSSQSAYPGCIVVDEPLTLEQGQGLFFSIRPTSHPAHRSRPISARPTHKRPGSRHR